MQMFVKQCKHIQTHREMPEITVVFGQCVYRQTLHTIDLLEMRAHFSKSACLRFILVSLMGGTKMQGKDTEEGNMGAIRGTGTYPQKETQGAFHLANVTPRFPPSQRHFKETAITHDGSSNSLKDKALTSDYCSSNPDYK